MLFVGGGGAIAAGAGALGDGAGAAAPALSALVSVAGPQLESPSRVDISALAFFTESVSKMCNTWRDRLENYNAASKDKAELSAEQVVLMRAALRDAHMRLQAIVASRWMEVAAADFQADYAQVRLHACGRMA